MHPVPDELLKLRAQEQASMGWSYTRKVKPPGYKKQISVHRRISEEEYQSLSPSARKTACRWCADPDLVAQLKAAERAFTLSFLEIISPDRLPSCISITADCLLGRESSWFKEWYAANQQRLAA